MILTPINKLQKPELSDVANIETTIHPYSLNADASMMPRFATLTDRNDAIPAPAVGQMCYVTATDELYVYKAIGAWCSAIPRIVRKATETQVVNNSTTFVDDSHLTFAAEANSVYVIHNYFAFDSSTVADFKTQWTVPSGATAFSHFLGQDGAGGAAMLGQFFSTSTVIHATNSVVGTITSVIEKLYLTTVGAGTMQFRWAQNTAVAIDTFIKTDSALVIQKVQ